MVIVESRSLGTIEVQEDQLIRFEQGMPGFEELRQFVLVEMEGDMPLYLMQSVELAEVSFLVGDPFHFYPDYEWDLPLSLQQELKLNSQSDLYTLAMITIPSEVSHSTINLMAPLLINRTEGLGKQYILQGKDYLPRQPLFANAQTQTER